MSKGKAGCILMALALGFGFWCFIGGLIVRGKEFKNIAIEKGHAEYDSVTGNWKWKEIKESEK